MSVWGDVRSASEELAKLVPLSDREREIIQIMARPAYEFVPWSSGDEDHDESTRKALESVGL